MEQANIRGKVRELIASGELPRSLPPAEKIIPGQTTRVTQIVVGRTTQGPCLICGEPDPMVSYTYPGGKVVRLHAACDAIWKQERPHHGTEEHEAD